MMNLIPRKQWSITPSDWTLLFILFANIKRVIVYLSVCGLWRESTSNTGSLVRCLLLLPHVQLSLWRHHLSVAPVSSFLCHPRESVMHNAAALLVLGDTPWVSSERCNTTEHRQTAIDRKKHEAPSYCLSIRCSAAFTIDLSSEEGFPGPFIAASAAARWYSVRSRVSCEALVVISAPCGSEYYVGFLQRVAAGFIGFCFSALLARHGRSC